jgi:hypothetical protein
MKTLCILLAFLNAVSFAQAPDPLAEKRAMLTEKIAAIQKDITGRKAPMLNAYVVAIDTLQKKFAAASDLDGAIAVKNEIERAQRNELLSKEAREKLPVPVQRELTRYEQSVAALEQARVAAEQKARAEHAATLLALQKQLTVANQLESAMRVRTEREQFEKDWKLGPHTTPTSAPANRAVSFQLGLYFDKLTRAAKTPKKSGIVGSKSKGKPFESTAKEPAHLVGVAVEKGAWFGTPILDAIQPIYEGKTGRFRGDTFGKQGKALSTIAEAKPGYVVSQILVSAPNDHVHGMKLVFQKLDTFRQTLVAEDTYSSEWLGIEFKEKSEKAGDLSKVTIGLHGVAGDWVSALGVLQAP